MDELSAVSWWELAMEHRATTNGIANGLGEEVGFLF
jgi:hypothetical protein